MHGYTCELLDNYVMTQQQTGKNPGDFPPEGEPRLKNPDIFFAKFDFPREMENVLLFFTG